MVLCCIPALPHHLIRELKLHIGTISSSSLTLPSTQQLTRHLQEYFLIWETIKTL